MYLVKFRNPFWNIFSEILSQGSFILLLVMSQVYLVRPTTHPQEKEWFHLKASRKVIWKTISRKRQWELSCLICSAEAVLFLESYGFGSGNSLSLGQQLLASHVVLVLWICTVGVRKSYVLDYPCPGTRKASSFGTFNSKLQNLSCNCDTFNLNYICLKLISK